MRKATFRLNSVPALMLAAALLLCKGTCAAQATAPAPQAAPAAAPASAPAPVPAAPASASAQAIDPVLTEPASQLKPAEIEGMQKKLADWPQLGRYRAANAALSAAEPGRVIFYGDSITDAWHLDAAFPGKPYINRGISGQTTPQMLVRFQQDVVALHPAAVLILAGTNDVAGNTGPSTLGMTEDNLRSMAEIAAANGIHVILASTLPVDDYPWRRGLQPAAKIRSLNAWLRDYCGAHGCTYLDYYTSLATPAGGMRPGTANDGVHPTAQGYAVMAPLAEAAIQQSLQKPPGPGTNPAR